MFAILLETRNGKLDCDSLLLMESTEDLTSQTLRALPLARILRLDSQYRSALFQFQDIGGTRLYTTVRAAGCTLGMFNV